jgi:AraC family ethanolamine operon transcriptional activator
MANRPDPDPVPTTAVFGSERLDSDGFMESVAGADGNVMVTGPEQAAWRIETLSLGGTVLQWLQEGAANTYHGAASRDHVSVFMGLSGTPPINARGAYLIPGHLTVVGPDAPLCSFAQGSCTYAGLSLPRGAFLETLRGLVPSLAPRFEGSGTDCTVPISPWRRILKTVEGAYAVASSGKLPGPTAARGLARELSDTLLGALLETVDEPKRGRPRLDREAILGRVTEYLNSGPYPRTVGGLAAHAGVTLRTLQNVCRTYFDMSPKRLLLLEDLQSVRTVLKNSDPSSTRVTDVLGRHGIWHWGRFARRYAQMFGETPSSTLRGD